MEGAGRRELAELVTDHVLGDEHGDELPAVVHGERQADRIRRDRASARPGLDDLLALRGLTPPQSSRRGDRRRTDPFLPNEPWLNPLQPFSPRRFTIMPSVRLLLRVLSPLESWPQGEHGCRPPEVRPSPPPIGWSTGFIVTPRLCGPASEPARASGLAERHVRVVGVRHLPDGRVALEVDHADLPRRQPDLGVLAVLGHERRGRAGGADELTALALLELDVVHHRARAGCGASVIELPGLMSAWRLETILSPTFSRPARGCSASRRRRSAGARCAPCGWGRTRWSRPPQGRRPCRASSR